MRIYSTCSRRGGLTLIEVVAAIAILGTLLVVIVLAKSRHTRQLGQARQVAAAAAAADELIAGWWVRGPQIPINDSGRIEGHEHLIWRTHVAGGNALAKLDAEIIRVEIRKDFPGSGPQDSAESLLFNIDLVMPIGMEDEASASDDQGAGSEEAR